MAFMCMCACTQLSMHANVPPKHRLALYYATHPCVGPMFDCLNLGPTENHLAWITVEMSLKAIKGGYLWTIVGKVYA